MVKKIDILLRFLINFIIALGPLLIWRIGGIYAFSSGQMILFSLNATVNGISFTIWLLLKYLEESNAIDVKFIEEMNKMIQDLKKEIDQEIKKK